VLDTTVSRTEQLASQCKAALVAKDYAGAQTAAAAALRLDPQYEEVWVAYGMASLRLGQEDRARQSYERALAVHQSREIKAKPDASQLYQEIYLLLLLHRSFEAESLLNRACAAFPNDRPLSTLSALFPEFKQNWEPWMVKSP
jgi:tetratricopeptide (TPR) repeat protein